MVLRGDFPSGQKTADSCGRKTVANCCTSTYKIFLRFSHFVPLFLLRKPQYNAYLSQGINLFAGSGRSPWGRPTTGRALGDQLPRALVAGLEKLDYGSAMPKYPGAATRIGATIVSQPLELWAGPAEMDAGTLAAGD